MCCLETAWKIMSVQQSESDPSLKCNLVADQYKQLRHIPVLLFIVKLCVMYWKIFSNVTRKSPPCLV